MRSLHDVVELVGSCLDVKRDQRVADSQQGRIDASDHDPPSLDLRKCIELCGSGPPGRCWIIDSTRIENVLEVVIGLARLIEGIFIGSSTTDELAWMVHRFLLHVSSDPETATLLL